MSDSIWKTPKESPRQEQLVAWVDRNGMHAGRFDTCYNCFCACASYFVDLRKVKRWCSLENLDDLIAQADKAERLQKAVENSREKLAAFMHDVWGNWFAYQLNNSTIENLQRWGIQSNTPYSSLTETDKDKDRKFADRIIEIIKDEIKQLIKGGVNETHC